MNNRCAAALWIDASGSTRKRTETLPPLEEGFALVRTRFSAISRGTESLVLHGRVPESEYERMRAPFQDGEFPFPVKYGYAAAGTVEEGPEGLMGRDVFCLHPHQDLFIAPADALRLLPPTVPVARAVLAANMETALNVVWDASLQPGDRVTVIGAGVVGSLITRLAASLPGADVTLVDIDPEKAQLAAALAVPFALPGSAPSDCDVVIHASGAPAGLTTALECAGFEARIVEASWYGDRSVEVPLGGAFHAKRLTILSSQVGNLPAARRARWDHGRRLDLALSLLTDPRLDTLISGETSFASIEDDYATILASPETLCHRIRY